MKRLDFLLLAASSLACSGLLLLTYKIISPGNSNKRLARYEDESLILSHENKYTLEEIDDLRGSFGKPYIFSEVLFEESPTKGKYVNKNLDGFRVSFANSFCDKAPRERTVWLFGGSTTYGYGVDDNQTISSNLAKELNQKGKEYCIINFGRGFFYSTQELLLYTKLISQSNKKPKYVFFIDGLNDHYHLLGSSFVPKYNYNKSFSLYNKIFHNRFTKKVFGKPSIPIKNSPTAPADCILNTPSISDFCKTLTLNATKRMINNWETASRLSSTYDIEFIPLLQPVPLYKHYFVNPFSKGNYKQHKFSGIGYALMDEEPSINKGSMKKLNYIDASTIFHLPNDSCKMPYVDPVHYSGCGGRLIAELMLERIEH